MKMITSDTAIDSVIVSIAKRGKTIQSDIHRVGVSILNRWRETGDNRPAVRQINDLIKAMPDGMRKSTFCKWVEAYFGFTFNKETKAYVYAKKLGLTLNPAHVAKAKQDPFWTFKPEPTERKALDLSSQVETLLKKVTQAAAEPVDGDKIDTEMLERLKVAVKPDPVTAPDPETEDAPAAHSVEDIFAMALDLADADLERLAGLINAHLIANVPQVIAA